MTLATQSAGCEDAGALADDVPVLLLHGDRDSILPPDTSFIVRMLIGHGEVEILPGTGHLMTEAADHLRDRLGTWIPDHLLDRLTVPRHATCRIGRVVAAETRWREGAEGQGRWSTIWATPTIQSRAEQRAHDAGRVAVGRGDRGHRRGAGRRLEARRPRPFGVTRPGAEVGLRPGRRVGQLVTERDERGVAAQPASRTPGTSSGRRTSASERGPGVHGHTESAPPRARPAPGRRRILVEQLDQRGAGPGLGTGPSARGRR